MSEFVKGDLIRLKTYAGHTGFGTPESRAVYNTEVEGEISVAWRTVRWGPTVQFIGGREEYYLNDYDLIERVGTAKCEHCDGRGFVKESA